MDNVTEDNLSDIINQECYMLFYFTASWCGPCQQIKPLIMKLYEGLESKNIKFYIVDIDNNDKLCEQCNVTSVPTFILFKDKKSVNQCQGADINEVANLIKPYC